MSFDEGGDAIAYEVQHGIEFSASERVPFRRTLDLDESPDGRILPKDGIRDRTGGRMTAC